MVLPKQRRTCTSILATNVFRIVLTFCVTNAVAGTILLVPSPATNSNTGNCTRDTESNMCRPVRHNGKVIELFPREELIFPFGISGIRRSIVCRPRDNGATEGSHSPKPTSEHQTIKTSEATNRPTTTQSTTVMTSADMQMTILNVAMDTTSPSPQLTTSMSSTPSVPTSPEGSTTPTTLGSTLPAHFTAPAGALAIVADEYTGKFWKITSTEEEWLSFETVLIDMTVDERDGNVFWTEQGGTRIWRCDIGSNTKETLFEGSNTPPREVAFDGQDRALYFSHILENNGFGFAISFIHVDNSESGRNDFVLLTSLVRALVIDEQRFAYWTDNDGLKCKHLSGTGSTETIDATLGNLPTTLSIDPTIANRVYLTTVNKVYLWEFSTGAWRKTDLSAYIGTHPANTQGTTQVNFLFFFNSVLYVQAGNGIGVIHNLDRNPIDHSEITVEYLALIGPQSPVALYVKSLFP